MGWFAASLGRGDQPQRGPIPLAEGGISQSLLQQNILFLSEKVKTTVDGK